MFTITDENTHQFEHAIQKLKTCSAVSIPFFSADEIQILVQQTQTLEFRTAKPVVGNNVIQDFDICFPAPLIDGFAQCAKMLEMLVAKCAEADPALCEAPYVINDFAVQRYPRGSNGIGIHKDGLRYRQFVFIITLSGNSRLFICSDRDGNGKEYIDDSPGHLVILPAPGFSGLKDEKDRPLHGVEHITEGRLSIGFRCKAVANVTLA